MPGIARCKFPSALVRLPHTANTSFSMTTCAVWTNRLRPWWWNDSGIRTIRAKEICWKFCRCCPFQWIHMFDRIEFACVRFCFRLASNALRYIRCSVCARPTGMGGEEGEWIWVPVREFWPDRQESVSFVCKAALWINTAQQLWEQRNENYRGGRREGGSAEQRNRPLMYGIFLST